MASLEAGVLAGCKGCSPPPYSAQMEEEAGRDPPPPYSKEMMVGDAVQDKRRGQDQKTKPFVVSCYILNALVNLTPALGTV
jgi:hypothetical protein